MGFLIPRKKNHNPMGFFSKTLGKNSEKILILLKTGDFWEMPKMEKSKKISRNETKKNSLLEIPKTLTITKNPKNFKNDKFLCIIRIFLVISSEELKF